MRSTSSVRRLGLAAMLGGALWSVAFAYHAAKPVGCVGSDCGAQEMREGGLLDGTLMVLSAVLIAAGLLALVILVRRSGGMGGLGRAGVGLGTAGLALVVVVSLVQALFLDDDFEYMPYFVVPGLALVVLGCLLLGVAILRSRVLPTWKAAVLIVGAAVMVGANEQTETAWLFVPFGLAWIVVGHAVWAAGESAVEQDGSPTARTDAQASL